MQNERVRTLIEKIMKYDAPENGYRAALELAVERAVNAGVPLRLVTFTCSTIVAGQMFSASPWMYVRTDTVGNNLETDLPRLVRIVQALREVYPTEVLIMIGNTDPYYIYRQQFRGVDGDREEVLAQFARRWAVYRDALEAWVTTTYPELRAQVVSWYAWEQEQNMMRAQTFEVEFNQLLESGVGSDADREWELRALRTQFAPEKYFDGLAVPEEVMLRDWIARKFVEYALQARWMYESLMPMILVQNEKPSELRSKMYQPLIAEQYAAQLPIVYFYGVDNGGYQ